MRRAVADGSLHRGRVAADALRRLLPGAPPALSGVAVTRVRRLWLTLALLWHRPRPSVGVLDRLHRPRDARGSRCGRW